MPSKRGHGNSWHLCLLNEADSCYDSGRILVYWVTAVLDLGPLSLLPSHVPRIPPTILLGLVPARKVESEMPSQFLKVSQFASSIYPPTSKVQGEVADNFSLAQYLSGCVNKTANPCEIKGKSVLGGSFILQVLCGVHCYRIPSLF